jgi:hypothetical protein
MPKTLELYAYLLVALVTTQQLTAQNPALTSPSPPSTFRETNDSVARFNRGDYKAIYQAGDEGTLRSSLRSAWEDAAK